MAGVELWKSEFDKLADRGIHGIRLAVMAMLYSGGLTPKENADVSSYVIDKLIAAVRADEREECAKLCELERDKHERVAGTTPDPERKAMYEDGAAIWHYAAAAIRERGQ